MARECPVCEEKYKATLVMHVLDKHREVAADDREARTFGLGLRCFCGYTCRYHDTLAYHWRFEGGLIAHLLKEKLG